MIARYKILLVISGFAFVFLTTWVYKIFASSGNWLAVAAGVIYYFVNPVILIVNAAYCAIVISDLLPKRSPVAITATIIVIFVLVMWLSICFQQAVGQFLFPK